jgi:two-component system, OmpR family, phosphate regulon sensor histidine kinase PhoR
VIKKIRKTYLFALITATYITVFVLLCLLAYHFFIDTLQIFGLLTIPVLFFIFSFIIIQNRAEKFIYKRIEKLYKDISLLESSSLKDELITTDIHSLTKNIQKFAKDKKIEIESLNIREEYRREFLGNISHELKTPLFTVQGYIETLLETEAVNNPTLRDKYIQRAAAGIERLTEIVQDLDMIAKFESNDLSLNIKKFDIIAEIQKVFDLLEMKADTKSILLMFDDKYIQPIYVKADKEKIRQVLTNLIMNSIKYGKQNGTTEVSVTSFSKGKVLVTITDNGIGIEKNNLTRIFERFYRVDKSGNRNEGGSGLGLAIVKHILEAHSEKILVNSDFGQGSSFSFTLKATK